MGLHLAFHSSAPYGTTETLLWNLRGSADGARVKSPTSRGPDGCESTGGSSVSSVRGPSCTGGGHGEAPPSNAGGSQQQQRNSSPLGRHSCSSTQLHSATATPLARTIAARTMRTTSRPRTQDASASASSSPSVPVATAVSLPSISLGGGSRRDLAPNSPQHVPCTPQGQGQGQPLPEQPDPSSVSPPHPSTPQAPRPPARGARNSMIDPSPRSRRATPHEHPGDAAAAAAAGGAGSPFLAGGSAAAAAAAGSVSTPTNTVSEPPPRFSRLQSMPSGARSSMRSGGGIGVATPEQPMRLSFQADHSRSPGGPTLGSSASMPTHNHHNSGHINYLSRHSGLSSPSPSPSPTSQQDGSPPLPLPVQGRGGGGASNTSIPLHPASVAGVAADPVAAPSNPIPSTGPQSPTSGRRVSVNPATAHMTAAPPAAPSTRQAAAVGQTRAQHHYHLNLQAATAESRRRSSEQDNVAGLYSSLRQPETPRPARRPSDEPAVPPSHQAPTKPASPVHSAAAGEAHVTVFRIRHPPPAPLRVSETSLPSSGTGSGNPGNPGGSAHAGTPTSTPKSPKPNAPARSPGPAASPGLPIGLSPVFARMPSFHPSPSPQAAAETPEANTISSAGTLSPSAEPQAPPPPPHPVSDPSEAPRPAHPEPVSPPASPSPVLAADAAAPAAPVVPAPTTAPIPGTTNAAANTDATAAAAAPAVIPAVEQARRLINGDPAAAMRLLHLVQQEQQQRQAASSEPPPFAPLPLPEDGLLHLSPSAPAAMRRPGAKWGVSDFRVMRKLYAGYASSVYRAVCVHSGTDVVLKAYNLAGLSTFLRHQVLRELHVHSRLAHQGVVQLIAAFKEGDLLVLVLEYIRGGSLDRLRRRLGGRLTEFQARHLVMRPLLTVLAALHTRGIMHRDIKPENLLFTEGWQLRMCDFGVSVCLSEERAVTRTGSREYMAPEVAVCPLKRGPGDGKEDRSLAYGPGVDVWSLGALTYEMLVGFTPFPGGPPPQRKSREAAGEGAAAELAFPAAVSQEARSFVRACLQVHPGDRPTVQQLMQHPWVTDPSPDASAGAVAPSP